MNHGQQVVLYARVSTDEQAKSGYSIADQMRQLDAHVATTGLTVVERIADEGYSGASPERPGLERILELAEASQIDTVIGVRRDRFFRSRLYRLLMDRDLEEFGVRLQALVSPAVLSGLTGYPYGVWYYNRRETVKTRKGRKVRKKPKNEWVAVPVPDAGVPRATVLSARKAIEGNEKFVSAGRREWQLSRGIIRCGECGCALVALTSHYDYTKKSGEKVKYLRPYYRCATYRRLGREGCAMHRNLHEEADALR